MKPGGRLRPRTDVMLNHALVLQLFPGSKVELGEGFFLPGRQTGLLCAECFPVHSSVSQDLAEAPHGLPQDAEWLGREIPKMLGGTTSCTKGGVTSSCDEARGFPSRLLSQ